MTLQDAVEKAAMLNATYPCHSGSERYHTVDQSPTTGAYRVIEHRDGYAPKVVAS